MKVVLDTNVLMSAIFWKGQPGEILELWSKNLFSLVISKEILTEYQRISLYLQRKYKAQNVEQLLNIMAINAFFVDPRDIEFPKCTDPDDDKFLAAAVFSGAKYIITGDKALLAVGTYKGGKVIKPNEFLKII